MSKEIQQYKKAIDTIKISESFMSRTELLLKDIPETQENITLNGNKKINIKKTIISLGGLAACIVAVMVLNRNISDTSPITTEIVTEASKATETVEITVVIPSENPVEEEILVDIEEIEDANAAVAGAQTPEISVPAPILEKTTTTTPAATESPNISEIPAQTTVAGTTASTEKRPKQTTAGTSRITSNEEYIYDDVKMMDPAGNEDEIDESIEETFDQFVDTGVPDSSFGVFGANVAIEPEIKLLHDIDYENTACNFMSYISGGYGEMESETMSAVDAKTLITSISGIIYDSQSKESKSTFNSEFTLIITDSAKSEIIFRISLTDKQSVVVETSLKDGKTESVLYMLKKADYEKLEQEMYLIVGTQSEYESFSALKSGK